MVSNPWGCDSPRLREGIRQTVAFIRQLSASIGPGRYPRIVLPIAGIRSNLERDLFTDEIMKELSDSVIVVGIEGALKTGVEGMKYVIDVPYPTRYHLAETGRREPIRGEKLSVGDFFLQHDRPFLSVCFSLFAVIISLTILGPPDYITPHRRSIRGIEKRTTPSTDSPSAPPSTNNSPTSNPIPTPLLEFSTTKSSTRETARRISPALPKGCRSQSSARLRLVIRLLDDSSTTRCSTAAFPSSSAPIRTADFSPPLPNSIRLATPSSSMRTT